MPTITQENRFIRIDTPLGEDALLLRGFYGTEGISFPFSFQLDLVSETDVTFSDIIGQNVTLTIGPDSPTPRYLNGIISNFSALRSGLDEASRSYAATMVPWFWLLSMTSDSRIFQEKTVEQIIEQIFNEKGLTDFRFSLTGTYDPREYCVQYRETDFNFVSRLLEQYGIFYFFEHEDGKHTMILTDSPDGHPVCPDQETAPYHNPSAGELMQTAAVTIFDKRQEIRVGKFTVNDFNFKTPHTDLLVELESSQSLGPGEREVYDYPAEYINRGQGETLANIRLQSEELKTTTITGESTCRAFSSGCKFDLTDFPIAAMNEQTYVLASINHSVTEPLGSSGEGGGATYNNSFTCFPFEVPFRPALVTPKPMIGGVQTAFVVGPAGEEIYTDEFGRVKVQFHWDREGLDNQDSSCWIRVSQVCAGAGWGAIDVPRIGHEVIVDFIEGDPDRPIITGRVYHGTNSPPFGLPDNGMVSGMKSNSTPGGGGYNEFTLNDTKGEEKITIHGQYDMNTTVENDQTTTVHNNRTDTIDVNDTESVGSNQSLSVGGNQTIEIKGDRTEKVVGNETITIDGARSEKVASGEAIEISAGRSKKVDGGESINISGGRSTEVKGDCGETVTGNKVIDASGDVSIQASGAGLLIKASGGAVSIEAATQIQISCGASTIAMDSGGNIVVKGTSIAVKSDGPLAIDGVNTVVKAAATLTTQAATITQN